MEKKGFQMKIYLGVFIVLGSAIAACAQPPPTSNPNSRANVILSSLSHDQIIVGLKQALSMFFESVLAKKVRTDPDARRH